MQTIIDYARHLFYDGIISSLSCIPMPDRRESKWKRLRRAQYTITHCALEMAPKGGIDHIIQYAIRSMIQNLKDHKAKHYIHNSFVVRDDVLQGIYVFSIDFIGVNDNLSAGGIFYEEEECLVY